MELKVNNRNGLDKSILFELEQNGRLLNHNSVEQTIDAYKQYFSEKDNSEKYRITVTINPICSNVLFNKSTEVVINEGSDDCSAIRESVIGNIPTNVTDYFALKGTAINITNAVKDTAISLKGLGNASYHCGLDIFNNHILRKKGFVAVNIDKIGGNNNFNTLSDLLRDKDGNAIEEEIQIVSGNTLQTGTTQLHLYQQDDVWDFEDSIQYNLVEENGWYGFLNPSLISVENYISGETGYTIDRCINNETAGTFIDMYPGRDLYSFIPKYNKSRKRVEKNWDYCLTYPASKVTDNELINGGLVCYSQTSGMVGDNYASILFKTKVKHNLKKGDYITMKFKVNGTVSASDPIKITSVGSGGTDEEHFFSVMQGDIEAYLIDTPAEIRMCKHIGTFDCEYYIRKFKKIPNHKFGRDYTEFGSTIGKIGFAKNIYSDDVAEINFTDDVITTGLVDNNGNPLTEIYLTLIKANHGYKEWYEDDNVTDEKVEYSHCFGEVSSGFDFGYYNTGSTNERKYNIRYISGSTVSSNKLESGITIENGEFYGDIVEFNPTTVTETVIEPVYHRFNTYLRDNGETIAFEDIIRDDYDSLGWGAFLTETDVTSSEGYFYKPHYRIPLREFSTSIQQGNDIRVFFGSWEEATEDEFTITGSTIYDFSIGEEIKLYKKKGNEDSIVGTITETNPRPSTVFKFTCEGVDNLDDYFIFKKNGTIPSYAYDLKDGTGRYLWKDILSFAELNSDSELYDSMFTNDAHYRHLNVTFYLKRQDPSGVYFKHDDELLADPKWEEISFENIEYEEENNDKLCFN